MQTTHNTEINGSQDQRRHLRPATGDDPLDLCVFLPSHQTVPFTFLCVFGFHVLLSVCVCVGESDRQRERDCLGARTFSQ